MDDTEVKKLVPCPTCHAVRGKPCQTLQNLDMSLIHLSRQRRAKEVKQSSLALKESLEKGT